MSHIKLSTQEAINGNYILKLDGYYRQNWINYDMGDFHKHGRIEFMYVESGECKIEFFDESLKNDKYVQYVFGKGDGVLIDSDEWHKLVVENKCEIINFEFLLEPNSNAVSTLKESVFLSSVLSEMLSKFKRYIKFSDSGNVKKFAALLLEEIERSKDFADYENVLNIYCNLLLIEIARSYKKVSVMQTYSLYVKRALKYIDSHFKEKIKVEDIASNAQVNYAYLERLFKENTGMTLVEYITRKKISLAEVLIGGSVQSISSIAEDLGFGSRQQFSNVFKQIKGVSPQKYRQNQSKKNKDVWYGFSGDYVFERMKINNKKEIKE